MKIRHIVLAAFLTTNAHATNNLEDIQFYTEELFPYNYTIKGKYYGFSYELIKNAIKETNPTLNFDKQLSFVPWSRAYNIALKEKDTAIFSTARLDKREKYFHWIGPISHAQRIVLSKKSRNIKIEKTEGLKNYTVTVIKDDIGDHLTQTHGFKDNVTQTYDLTTSLNYLKTGAADILLYNPEATILKMKELGFNINEYKFGTALSSGYFYIALSKATHKSIANQLQLAIDNYKKTEDYKKLRIKYNLNLYNLKNK